MPSTLPSSAASRHPVLPDIGRHAMAKANARVPDMDWPVAVGRAIQRAVSLVGWSHKEAAARIGVDDAEFGKWLSGGRRPQMDRIFAVEELRQPIVIAFAELAGAGVEIETVVRVRRIA